MKKLVQKGDFYLNNIAIIIPYYNHPKKIKKLCNRLLEDRLHILVVNDGSSQKNRKVLDEIDNIEILDLEKNGGKGYALKAGFKYLKEHNFTHALQIDADFQHDVNDVKSFLNLYKSNPNSFICGSPIYDKDIPKSRLYGRKITNFWIQVNTLGGIKRDGMCGFRLYPLNILSNTILKVKSNSMDFDTDILVRAFWDSVDILWIDTRIKYTKDGVSHFRTFRDNVLISRMHAKLFFRLLGMILKNPKRVFYGKSLV